MTITLKYVIIIIMKPYGIIYKITNIINNKVYIGQTVYSLNKRWGLHVKMSSLEETDPNTKSVLHRAIRKYGKDSFKSEILAHANSVEELNELEIFYINQLNTMVPNGYNLKEGGLSGKWSEEARKRISEVRKTNIENNEELKSRITSYLQEYQNQFSEEEYSLLMSDISKSYWSEDNKKNKSIIEKDRWEKLTKEEKIQRLRGLIQHNKTYWTEQNKEIHSKRIRNSQKYKESNASKKMIEKCGKRIVVINDKNNTKKTYDSKSEVIRHFNIGFNTLNSMLEGKRSGPYKGYYFKKAE